MTPVSVTVLARLASGSGATDVALFMSLLPTAAAAHPDAIDVPVAAKAAGPSGEGLHTTRRASALMKGASCAKRCGPNVLWREKCKWCGRIVLRAAHVPRTVGDDAGLTLNGHLREGLRVRRGR